MNPWYDDEKGFQDNAVPRAPRAANPEGRRPEGSARGMNQEDQDAPATQKHGQS